MLTALDHPYLSAYLAETVIRNRWEVIDTPAARRVLADSGADLSAVQFVVPEDAAAALQDDPERLFYTSSESSIELLETFPFPNRLVRQVRALKDKEQFRIGLAERYPDFFFKAVAEGRLHLIDPDILPCPCIVKPAVGFFSIGVKNIADAAAWKAFTALEHPGISNHVVNTERWIIEELIEGEEFAVDAWFDDGGQPVIAGIYQHLFASEEDVSDRIYMTSADIVSSRLEAFTGFLADVGALFGLRQFPVHAEVRISPMHGIIPIEINPLRFGGWCTTADLARYAYGFNQYELYFAGERPDWVAILPAMGSDRFSLTVLDNAAGVPPETIRAFRTDKLLAAFSHPLEFRPVDFRIHPVFGFLFARTGADRMDELYRILQSDLKEFLLLQPA